MHGASKTTALTGDPAARTALARRIAELSDEYLSADRDRRDAISLEVRALIDGDVLPLPR